MTETHELSAPQREVNADTVRVLRAALHEAIEALEHVVLACSCVGGDVPYRANEMRPCPRCAKARFVLAALPREETS